MPNKSQMVMLYAMMILALVTFRLPASPPIELEATTIEGKNVKVFAPNRLATVLLFVSTDCPISNKYAPEIKRLVAEFAQEKVQFWLVYPDPSTSTEVIAKHVDEYDLPAQALVGNKHLLKLAEPEVTPEAAVFNKAGKLVYKGRIDDRFASLGVERSIPTERNVQETLTKLLEGMPITKARTKAIGCRIPKAEKNPD